MISRSQIYFVKKNPTQGRERAGRRPVLVVFVDAINRQPLVIAVVAGTDAKNVPRDYPTNVRVTAKELVFRWIPYSFVFSSRPWTQPVSMTQRLTGRISPALCHRLEWPR